jgi:hypothetical protein
MADPSVKGYVGRHGHFIQNRKYEILLAVVLMLVGSLLLYDAYDTRGKKLPWPASVLAPW